MSDRLAVMHRGRVMQVGTPSEVYSRPASAYVATFLGSTNLFPATVTEVGPTDSSAGSAPRPLVGTCRARPGRRRRRERDGAPRAGRGLPGGRRERRDPVDDGSNLLSGRVEALVFRGAHTGVSSTATASGSRRRSPTTGASRRSG